VFQQGRIFNATYTMPQALGVKVLESFPYTFRTAGFSSVGVGRTDLEVTVGGISLDVGVGCGDPHATKTDNTSINSTMYGNNLF
jgi:hypothetical protein